MDWKDTMKAMKVPENDVILYWIGQAGFAFKLPNSKVILIDPYLSDSVYEDTKKESGFAFKRVAPPLFTPEQLSADYLLITHEHGDHLDTGAVKLLSDSALTVSVGNEKVSQILNEIGVQSKKHYIVKAGSVLELPDFTLYTIFADHGELAPGALGFVLDFGFVRVYYSGDTRLNSSVIAQAKAYKPEVALLPINGAFGNLNGTEAMEFAKALGCSECIPHHFWTFPTHYGNPMEAIQAFGKLGEDCHLRLVTPGEPISLRGMKERE